MKNKYYFTKLFLVLLKLLLFQEQCVLFRVTVVYVGHPTKFRPARN